MAHIEINDRTDLRCWVRTQLIKQQTTQRELAKKMGVAYPRLSEAISGKPAGKKYLAPMIKLLGGNVEDFRAIM